MDENQVDFLEMSSEDFANFDFDSAFGDSAESSEPEDNNEVVHSDEVETEEVLEESLEPELEGGESPEFIDHEPESFEESPEELMDEDEADEEVIETEPEEQSTKKSKGIVGTKILMGDSEITINSIDEAKQLLEASGKHYQDAQAYNQSKDLIKALQDNSIDASQLAFAIDLLNKDPKAINALVKDLDLVDILDDSSEYQPQQLPTVDPLQERMQAVLKTFESSPTYSRTVQVVGQQWDGDSLAAFKQNPEWMTVLNNHMADGTFDKVSAEVQKRRMMGLIPTGMPDYQVYNMVGDSMYAPKQQAQPIRKPVRQSNVVQKKAMSTPRSKPTVTEQSEDILNMSSEDFKRKYGDILNRYN